MIKTNVVVSPNTITRIPFRKSKWNLGFVLANVGIVLANVGIVLANVGIVLSNVGRLLKNCQECNSVYIVLFLEFADKLGRCFSLLMFQRKFLPNSVNRIDLTIISNLTQDSIKNQIQTLKEDPVDYGVPLCTNFIRCLWFRYMSFSML